MAETKPALLIFELHHLGDALMSFPFIRGALEKHDVWVVCTPSTVELYKQILAPDRILGWLPPWQGGRWSEMWRIREVWRKIGAATAVCVWADVRVHGAMFFSGAARRMGFPMNQRNYYAHERPWRKRNLRVGKFLQAVGAMFSGGRLLTDALQRQDYHQHHLEDWRQLAKGLNLLWNPAEPWLGVSDRALPESLAKFLETNRSVSRKIWLIHSGGRLPSKLWPMERFFEVREYLRGKGISSVLVGERWGGESSDELTFYAPPLSLEQFAGALVEVDGFLGNDSFPAHLAAALGKRVVAIFGSGNPDWFSPWGNRTNSLAARNCPHWPCVDRCQMPSYICLEAVEVKDVIEQIEKTEK